MSININIPVDYHAFRVEYDKVMGVLFTDISISLPTNGNPNKPRIVSFKGIWDTGATSTVVTKNVIESLGLVPSGKAEVSGVNSCQIANTYIIDLYLPNNILLHDWRVIESEINSPGVSVLIGMDVIHNGDFSVNNGLGHTVFMFAMPPFEHFENYVEKSDVLNRKKKQKYM